MLQAYLLFSDIMTKFSYIIIALISALIIVSCASGGTPTTRDIARDAMKVTYTDAVGAADMLNADLNMGIVDVRTGVEFKSGHIAGAVHNGFIGFGFKKRLKHLDRHKTYLIACRTGHRSKPAIRSFRKLGFAHVVHLDGGMQAWKKIGLPIVRKEK